MTPNLCRICVLLGFRSSPANGVWSTDPFAERWIAPNGDTSTSEYFGDQHYYNYVADSQNVETMMSPRYCRHLLLGIKSRLATCNSHVQVLLYASHHGQVFLRVWLPVDAVLLLH